MDVNESLLNYGNIVGVGVSGGKDSMALLHWLAANAKRLNIKIIAINIDHGIRGESSQRDSMFVRDYCKENGIPCQCYKTDCKPFLQNASFENAAREARYKIFYNIIKLGQADYIATAHHSLDNAETVLLHILRGSGLKGASGIAQITPQKIIRPLLNTDKQSIDDYIAEHNIPFVTDETNFKTDYSRNFLRLHILTEIIKKFPSAINNINKFSRHVARDDKFIEKHVPRPVIKNREAFIPIEHFENDDTLINREIIIALKELGIVSDIESVHIELIKNLKNAKTGSKLNVKHGIIAIKTYKGIILTSNNTPAFKFCTPFTVGIIKLPNGILEIERTDSPKGLYIDIDKLPDNTVIRYRQSGDIFEKFGGGGTVSLKEYLIDQKIPAIMRNSLPLIAWENQIYAIIGVAISDRAKVTDDSKNIYELKFSEDDNG